LQRCKEDIMLVWRKFEAQEGRSVDSDHEEYSSTHESAYREFARKGQKA
jgi:hypothetical protein